MEVADCSYRVYIPRVIRNSSGVGQIVTKDCQY